MTEPQPKIPEKNDLFVFYKEIQARFDERSNLHGMYETPASLDPHNIPESALLIWKKVKYHPDLITEEDLEKLKRDVEAQNNPAYTEFREIFITELTHFKINEAERAKSEVNGK